jgi:DNA polymerase-3 subunit alpha
MVKILSRKPLGIKNCFDIGLKRDHNFIFENGLVASNCFNKSHSTAYAYVTYQTAYLKANYPVEYMTALLSASSDSKEKVEKYRENCQRMNIEVKAPDINRSKRDFTPDGHEILFGLLAIPSLGEGVIESIILAREDGVFKSLADFCQRIDQVNRRALETLIYAGAFDSFNSNRNQLIHDIDLIIPWAQKKAKDKESGQMSLFDLQVDPSSPISEEPPVSPSVADFSLQEKLKLEKEHIGFYLSQHPLKSIKQSLDIFSPVNLADLGNLKSRQRVSTVVMINEVKRHVTKNNTNMGFMTLEDATSSVEAVVFSDAYGRLESFLEKDKHLMIWGKVDYRDDRVQLIVEDAEPIEEIKYIKVDLTPEDVMTSDRQIKLKIILQEDNKSDKKTYKVPVIAVIDDGKERYLVRLGEKFWVNNAVSTLESLEKANFSATSQNLVN